MTRVKIRGADFLFSMPTFVRGASRVLDLGATQTIYTKFENEKEADCRAIYNDWVQVGVDIYDATEKY